MANTVFKDLSNVRYKIFITFECKAAWCPQRSFWDQSQTRVYWLFQTTIEAAQRLFTGWKTGKLSMWTVVRFGPTTTVQISCVPLYRFQVKLIVRDIPSEKKFGPHSNQAISFLLSFYLIWPMEVSDLICLVIDNTISWLLPLGIDNEEPSWLELCFPLPFSSKITWFL